MSNDTTSTSPSKYPCLEALYRAGGEDPANTTTNAPQHHPVLEDETAKIIILRYHQQRAELRRAIEECSRYGEAIPPRLVGPLQHILSDIQDMAPTHETDGTMSNTLPSAADGVPSPLKANRSMELTQLIAQCGHHYVQNVSSGRAAAASDPQISLSESEAALNRSETVSHTKVTSEAILSSKYRNNASISSANNNNSSYSRIPGGASSLPGHPTPKQLLDKAFEAKQKNDHRAELMTLVEYLRLGQEGYVSLDTSSTTRLLRRIADAHMALGEHISAEQYYFDWYLICEKIGDVDDSLRALTCLGKACHERGDLEKAEQWYGQARERVAQRDQK